MLTPFLTDAINRTLTLVLAGGQGERLYPLTKYRSKPSVPFGGNYRIIDFTLSNCLNSGFRRIYLLTQYLSQSLSEHIYQTWSIFNPDLGEFMHIVPPQRKKEDRWYEGTADAVFHNINILSTLRPQYVMILSGDHIYKMNYAKMLDFHIEKKAEVTISTYVVPREEASRFGIIHVDQDSRVIDFIEKPADPPGIPGDPGKAMVNMGVYIFNIETLVQTLSADAKLEGSAHDFGRNIIPDNKDRVRMFGYRFEDENRKETGYWKDIGTLDSYYEAALDLCGVIPEFNLYDPYWPVRGQQHQYPPVKTVFAQTEEEGGRRGEFLDSLACSGVIVSGGLAERSILGPMVRINSYATVEDSILFDNVDIGRHAKVRRAIIDKNVRVPEGMQIGYDLEADRQRFTVTDSGIVVIAKNERLD